MIKKLILTSLIFSRLFSDTIYVAEKDSEIEKNSFEYTLFQLERMEKNHFDIKDNKKKRLNLFIKDNLYLNFIDFDKENKINFYLSNRGKNFKKEELNDISNRLLCYTPLKVFLEAEDIHEFYFYFEYVKNSMIESYHITHIINQEVCTKYKKDDEKKKLLERINLKEKEVEKLVKEEELKESERQKIIQQQQELKQKEKKVLYFDK
jgi:hypothetical protein